MNMEDDILTQDEEMMEDDILTQDEEMMEEEMKKEAETKKTAQSNKKPNERKTIEASGVEETFEGFKQEERLGIINTLTGDIIDGFDPKRDEGLVKLGKVILNQLNKISIAFGTQ